MTDLLDRIELLDDPAGPPRNGPGLVDETRDAGARMRRNRHLQLLAGTAGGCAMVVVAAVLVFGSGPTGSRQLNTADSDVTTSAPSQNLDDEDRSDGGATDSDAVATDNSDDSTPPGSTTAEGTTDRAGGNGAPGAPDPAVPGSSRAPAGGSGSGGTTDGSSSAAPTTVPTTTPGASGGSGGGTGGSSSGGGSPAPSTQSCVGNPCSWDFTQGLGTGVWSFVDPAGGSSVRHTGSAVEITVPGGTEHDIYNDVDTAPKLMQSIANTDFDVSVHFGAQPTQTKQIQGLVVTAADGQKLRIDIVKRDATQRPWLFVAEIRRIGGVWETRPGWFWEAPSPTAFDHLRMRRVGAAYTFLYSADGANWNAAGTRVFAELAPTAVGVYAGNARPDGTAVTDTPAYTARFLSFTRH